jgi:hypothetical protein
MDRHDDDAFDPTAALRTYLTEDDTRMSDVIDALRARYVSSERDDRINRQIERLIRNAVARKDPRKPHSVDNRKAGVGFVVIGESGAGKTTALDRAFMNHPAFPGHGITGSGCPLITVQAPSPCTLGQVAMEILDVLDYRTQSILPENQAWRRARFQIKENHKLFLRIGDAQHVMHTLTEHDKKKFADTLKNLMVVDKVQLILDGIDDLVPFLQMDRQLKRRLKYVNFRNVSAERDAEFIESTISNYAEKAGLKLAVSNEDMLTGRLAHAACHQMGLVIEILVDAIEVSLTEKRDTLSIGEFAEAYTDRTLDSPGLNPFVVRAWETIDCSVIQKKTEFPVDGSHPKPTTRGRHKK